MNRKIDGSNIEPGKTDSRGKLAESGSRFKDWAIRLGQSDREAFADLFQSMSARLVRYAQNITQDQASAYDVLQDVFLKLWEMRDRINPESSLQSLLYTMTRNAALNMNRKSGALVFNGTDGEENYETALTGNQTSVEALLEGENLAGHLQHWIDELPDRRKEAFILSRHHDLSHKEISKIMGLSERTVNTHIFLALKQLRNRLDALKNDTTKL